MKNRIIKIKKLFENWKPVRPAGGFKIENSQRGMALIWAMFVSMMILVFGFTLTMITVKELRIASNVDESNRAYSAAEAGVERALYRVKEATSTNIKWGCDPTVDEAPPPVSLDPTLVYKYTLKSTCDVSKRAITIESTGTSRGVNTRKIRTNLTLAPPDNIDKFDLQNGFPAGFPTSGPFTYFNPQQRDIDTGPAFKNYIILQAPIVVQQFDLNNLDRNTVGSGSGFTVGMSNGIMPSTPGSTDFGLNFSQGASNRVRVRLAGRVRSLPQFSSNWFDFPAVNTETYRVKMEYARYGSFGGAGGFTIIKASVLKRNTSGPVAIFECLNANFGYVVYNTSLIGAWGDNLSLVKVDTGRWISDNNNPSLPGGYIRVGNNIQLDNMVFWGRE